MKKKKQKIFIYFFKSVGKYKGLDFKNNFPPLNGDDIRI